MNQSEKEKHWNISLIIILLVLGFVIIFELNMFISGVLGALTLYAMLRKRMFFLTETKKVKAPLASIILIITVILLVLIPFSLFILMVADKISTVHINFQALFEKVNSILQLIEERTGTKLFTFENLSFIPKLGLTTVQGLAQNIYSFLMNAFVMIFILYFMLVKGREFENFLWDMLPFKKDNKREVMHEINIMIRSNAIGIPLLALIQMAFAYLGYILFDVDQAFWFAVLTGVVSILPVVGTGLIWAPLSIYLLTQGEYFNGIGLIIYGVVVIGNIDNFFRFLLQKKLADVHPLITIFGVILGLKFLGFWGVIFGPVLLSLFILLLKIYRRDYLNYSLKDRLFAENKPDSDLVEK